MFEGPLQYSDAPQIGPAGFLAPEILFRPDLVGEELAGVHTSYACKPRID